MDSAAFATDDRTEIEADLPVDSPILQLDLLCAYSDISAATTQTLLLFGSSRVKLLIPQSLMRMLVY